MPKPLFQKLAARAAAGFFCILFGCAFSFRMDDPIFLSMSLLLGGCFFAGSLLLFCLIRRQDYLIISGTCTGTDTSAYRKTQQVRFTDVSGTRQVFTISKQVKILQGHDYNIYFSRPQDLSVPISTAISDGFLGLEEIEKSPDGPK